MLGNFGEEKWSIIELLFFLSSSHDFPPLPSFKPNALSISLYVLVLDHSLAVDYVYVHIIGSILSSGGSSPFENAQSGDWADMVDGFQKLALQSRLEIPLIYGIDAVHGNNSVYGATIFPHNVGLGATRLVLTFPYVFKLN